MLEWSTKLLTVEFLIGVAHVLVAWLTKLPTVGFLIGVAYIVVTWFAKLLTVEFLIGVAHVGVTAWAIVWAGRHATKQSQAQYANSLKLKEIEKLEREIECLGKIKSMWAMLRFEQDSSLKILNMFKEERNYDCMREYIEVDTRKFTDMQELVAALFVATPHNLVKEMQEIPIAIGKTRAMLQTLIMLIRPKSGEQKPNIEMIGKWVEIRTCRLQKFLTITTNCESDCQEMIDKTKQKIATLQPKQPMS